MPKLGNADKSRSTVSLPSSQRWWPYRVRSAMTFRLATMASLPLLAGCSLLSTSYSPLSVQTASDFYQLKCSPTASLKLQEPLSLDLPLWTNTSDNTPAIRVEEVNVGFKCRW